MLIYFENSLQKICLYYVLAHLNIWCGRNKKQFLNLLNNNSVEITRLPENILDNMLHLFTFKNYLRSYHIDLFIHKHSQILDLASRPVAMIKRGISVIRNVHANITSLNISDTKMKVTYLKQLIKVIPFIETLNLESTETSDSVLLLIGNDCPRLQYLNISECNAVTDIGIRNLCEIEHQVDGKNCKLIRQLFVESTSITDVGASIAVLQLPHLQYIDYQDMLDVIEIIYKENNLFKSDPNIQFKLGVLSNQYSWSKNISSSAMNAAVHLCQNVFDLKLMGVKKTDDWIHQLADFPHLTKLSLTCLEESAVNYNEHIAYLLTRRGMYLEELTLVNFEEIDLWHLGSCCCQLKLLNLKFNRNYLRTTQSQVNLRLDGFSKINRLVIICLPDNDISVGQLETMLTNIIQVERLEFCSSQTVTDDLLCRVLRHNLFSKLRSLEFYRCNNIHKCSLLIFVNLVRTLHYLSCFGCAGVRVSDSPEVESSIHKENANLRVSIFD